MHSCKNSFASKIESLDRSWPILKKLLIFWNYNYVAESISGKLISNTILTPECRVYGTRKGIKQVEVSPGRKAPKRLPLPDLIYTRVVKTRVGRRVVGVDTEVVFGEKDAAMEAIAHSPVSSHINTAFIERNNLTIRERNRRLTRKTLGFSKRKKLLISSLNIYFGISHFVKTHKGLMTRIDQNGRKWMHRTPMMAAGITDHVWTLSELINFRVYSL